MKKLFIICATVLAVCATPAMAASAKLPAATVAAIKKAGTDKAALAAITAKLIKAAPANKRAAVAAAIIAALTPEAAADKAVLVAITDAAVGAAKTAAAANGAGNAGQTAAGTEVAEAILHAADPQFATDIRNAAVQAGASLPQLTAVATSEGVGSNGVTTAGQSIGGGGGGGSSTPSPTPTAQPSSTPTSL